MCAVRTYSFMLQFKVQSDILRQNIFSYSYLMSSSQLIYWEIRKKKQEKKKEIKEGHFSAILWKVKRKTWMVEGLRSLKNHLVCAMEIVLAELNAMSITSLAIFKLPLTPPTSKSSSDAICNSFIPINAHKFLHFLVLFLFTEITKLIRTEIYIIKLLFILENHVKTAVISNKNSWIYLSSIIWIPVFCQCLWFLGLPVLHYLLLSLVRYKN